MPVPWGRGGSGQNRYPADHNLTLLLLDLLGELLFRFETTGFLGREFDVTRTSGGLLAQSRGEVIEDQPHRLSREVKAITYHGLKVEQQDGGWLAEVIVDITSTGATLKANGLKVLDDGVILKSRAALTGSLRADWTEGARAALRKLLGTVEAVESADSQKMLVAAHPIPDSLIQETGMCVIAATSVLAPSSSAVDHARKIAESGAGPVSIMSAEFIFDQESRAYEKYVTNLKSGA